MKKVSLLLLDVKSGSGLTEVQCGNLNDYYKHLKCDTIDIARRKIGNKYFDIFIDDVGLYDDSPIVSAIFADGTPALVGNLIFANHDAQGNTISLSDEDVETITKSIVTAIQGEKRWPVCLISY